MENSMAKKTVTLDADSVDVWDYIPEIKEDTEIIVKGTFTEINGDRRLTRFDMYSDLKKLMRSLRECQFKIDLDLSEVKGVKEVEEFGPAYYYKSLRSIKLPKTVKKISYCAFYYLESLEEVVIPEGVAEIERDTFLCCKSLKKVVISEGVKKIASKAFYSCESLEEITIPGSVETIDEDAFAECSSLKKVTISDGIKTIGKGAFSHCTALKLIELPESLESICDYAFLGCHSLENVTIPSSARKGYAVFQCCDSLKNVTISEGTRIITRSMLACCKSLENIKIPDTVEIIRDSAFSECPLKNLVIPESVEEISPSAFSKCSALESIKIDENNRFYDSRNNCNAIIEKKTGILVLCCKNTVIPKEIKKAYESAFSGCKDKQNEFTGEIIED